MTARHLASPLAVAAGLVLGLGACTAGGDAAGPGTPSTATSSSSAASVQGQGTPEIVDDRTPLEKWWFGHYNIWDREGALLDLARTETFVAECMAEKGWEYWPVDFAAIDAEAPLPELDIPPYGSLAYAQQFGFGVTIDDGSQELYEAAARRQAESEASDPNYQYRLSLSESALEQYEFDLMGPPPPTPEQIAAGELPEDDDNGCVGAASEQLSEDEGSSWYEDPGYLALEEEIRVLREAVEKDQRVLEARGAWIRCMSDAGFPQLVDRDAARESIARELWAYTDRDEEPPPDVLAELQEREVALAMADVGCQSEARVDLATFEVERELERAFVKEHRAEMEEIFLRFDIGSGADED